MRIAHRLGALLAAWAALSLAPTSSEAEVPGGSRPIVLALPTFEHACFTRASLADDIGVWLGRAEIDSRLTIELEVDAGGVVFRVLRDGTPIGERRLAQNGLTCSDFRAAVSLAIASAIDATILASLGVAAVAQAPPSAPAHSATVRDPAPPPQQARPRPHPARPAIGLQLDGAVLGNVLAVPALALSLAARFDLPVGGLRVGALASLPAEKTLPGGAATVSLVAARADACRRSYTSMHLALDACVGGLAGVHRAQGRGLASPNDAVTPWVALAVGAELTLFRGQPVEGVLELDAVGTLLRWQLVVDEGGAPFYRLTGAILGATVLAGARFRAL